MKGKTNHTQAIFIGVLSSTLPFVLPAFLILIVSDWMPNEITYPKVSSVFFLSIMLVITDFIFYGILKLFGYKDKGLNGRGLIGILDAVFSQFFYLCAGYFIISTLGLTAVELSLTGVSIVAIISAIILTLLLSLIEDIEDKYDEDENTDE
ncbi:epimerase [Priestia taiwanensis]|uniref:Uncharacterized protein n=1 Tax=Priestia taiwanensis TaxID=1347902 RepID=A0A917EPA1_9BACI|nr:epimerase [Priestia taiwanensis]MBM7362442.1 CDP-diglyceride synthetase [Priestia taiwanensis]GGE62262.1 hypothetical protein GCM10007140_10650 [Priestia taiwanensis]